MRRYFSLLIVFAVLLGFSLSGCTRYAKEEQLKGLEKTKVEALAAEQKLEEKRAERKSWEQKLAAKQEEMDAKKKERDIIASKLGKDY